MSEEEKQTEHGKPPSEKAERAGDGGIVPPVEHRFKPGWKGGPGRPPNAGFTIREHINDLIAQNLTEEEIRKVARSKSAVMAKRAAAERVLRMIETGDIADFAGLLRGENDIEDLRAMGINTEVVKKLKQKTRKVSVGEGKVEEIIDREIELYDRAGADFDRVVNHTDGTPTQSVEQRLSGGVQFSGDPDLKRLSKQELEAYLAIVEKMTGDSTTGKAET